MSQEIPTVASSKVAPLINCFTFSVVPLSQGVYISDKTSVTALNSASVEIAQVNIIRLDFSIVESVKDSEYQLDNAEYIILGER